MHIRAAIAAESLQQRRNTARDVQSTGRDVQRTGPAAHLAARDAQSADRDVQSADRDVQSAGRAAQPARPTSQRPPQHTNFADRAAHTAPRRARFAARAVRPEFPLAAIVLAFLVAHAASTFATLHHFADTKSLASAAPARVPTLRLDPNTASAAELDLLPGVGPAIAQSIVSYRENAPVVSPFRVPADLDAVKRIGPAIVAQISPYLAFDSSAGGTAAVDAHAGGVAQP